MWKPVSMQIPRRIMEVQLERSPKSGWQAFHINRVRWIEDSPAAAIGARENSREEIAADINRGATYFVISEDKLRVNVSVRSSQHDRNNLHAFPEGSGRDRILDLPTYP